MKKVISIIAAVAAAIVIGGCKNTGVKVVASSASYTNIADINYDEYKIPVLSIIVGPKATVWVNKDYGVLDSVEISGCVTNTTSALGFYDSAENKKLNLKMKFTNAATNGVETSH